MDFSLVQLIGEYLFTQKVREDERIADDIAARTSDAFGAWDAEGLYALLTQMARENDARILATDQYGVVQTDSAAALNGHKLTLPEIAAVLGGADSAYGYYNLEGGGWLALQLTNADAMGVHVSTILSGATRAGALVYITSAEEFYGSLRIMQRQILTWLLLVAVCVMVVSFLLASVITKPLAELNQGILRMTKGDMATRVRIRGKSEFAQLARAFNQMTEELGRLNTTRNEFISNASHELKTPLSTSKILVETLLYQDRPDPDMTKELLGDIDREIDRMNLLVSDLLSLVNLESGRLKLQLTEVSLSDIVNETVRRLKPYAQERKVDLQREVWDDVRITGDAMKLGQIIYNLTDNAVKYTPAGGAVRVDLARSGKKAVVTVTDNGIGIPEKDVPHIFDRFYRVDKARSRDTGGTGLGLSIVKQMVQLHGGEITFTSEENVGSVFTVELPVAGPAQTL